MISHLWKTNKYNIMIRKAILTGFIYFCLFNLLFGQSIHLKNGIIENPEYFKANVPSSRKIKSNKNPLNGYFCVIQFNKALNATEKETLANKGIILLNYIPDNSYTAVLENQESTKTDLIKNIIELPANFKYDLRLDIEGKHWFEKISGFYDINLVLVKKTDPELALSILEKDFKLEVLSTSLSSPIIKLRIKKEDLHELAKINWIQWIEPVLTDFKLYNSSCSNHQRIGFINSDIVGESTLTGKNIWVGIWDGGEVGSHFDIYGRITSNTEQKENSHSTHVAGTIGGRGLIDPLAKGMASEVQIYESDIQRHLSEIIDDVKDATDKYKLSVANNSWGFQFDRILCSNPIPYTSEMALIDQVSIDFPELTQVFANGNEQIQCHLGYGTTTWTMKNVIFVGATNDSSLMSDFSSFGPMFDGRITPHISADGVDVLSTQDGNRYESYEGTSMATPVVSGGIALLNEKYLELNGTLPKSELVKAVLCNTADDKNDPGPDYQYGFGVANFKKALSGIVNKEYIQSSLSSTTISQEHELKVPANCSELKVLIAWNDKPGTPLSDKVLVNDLNITLKLGQQQWLPWVLNPAEPFSPAQRGEDHLNNIEQITIENPAQGDYILNVSSSNITSDQSYTISYIFILENDIELTFPRGGEKLISENKYIFHWDIGNLTDKYDAEITYDGINWQTIASDLDAQHNFVSITLPQIVTNKAQFRLNINGQQVTSNPFVVAPQIELEEIIPGYQNVEISWKKIDGINHYNIYKITELGLSKAGESTESSYIINNMETNNKYWYSISPVFDNGDEGERCIAVELYSIPEYDIMAKEIINPWPGSHLGSSEELILRIKNVGDKDIPENSILNLGYTLNNGNIKTNQITTTEVLAKGQTMDILCGNKLFMETPNSYTIKAWVSNILDTENTANDTIFRYVRKSEVIREFPYKDGFESQLDLIQLITSVYDPVYLYNGWYNDRDDDGVDWWPVRGPVYQEDNGPREGHSDKYLYTETFFQPKLPVKSNIISPSFDLTSCNNPQLKFYYHIWSEYNDMGSLHIDLYKENSDTWIENIIEPLSQSGGDKWKCCMIDLNDYRFEGTIRIRFRMESSESIRNSIAIDDFEISESKTHDFQVLSISPKTGEKLFTSNEAIAIDLLNMGNNTYETGTTIPVGLKINENIYNESITIQESVSTLDTVHYVFDTKADFSDLTQRYNLNAWSDYSNDQYRYNDSITNHYIQSYVETTSNCIANYYLIGIGYFKLDGIAPQFSAENFTACENTTTEGYSLYNENTIRMYAGKKYDLTLKCLTPPSEYQIQSTGVFFKVWIDFNHDGRFAAEESVFENDWPDYIFVNDSIEIPANLPLTGKTRLRVRASIYKEVLEGDGDGESFKLGETEDYIVDLRNYPNFDVALTGFNNMPESGINLPSDQKVSFSIQNLGLVDINKDKSLKFAYALNNSSVVEQEFTLSSDLNAEQSTQLSFNQTADLSKEGEYTIKLWLVNPDENEINDTIVYRVQSLGLTDAENYFEDFESGNSNWFDASEGNTSIWINTTPAKQILTSAASGDYCWVTKKEENYPDNARLVLQSPVFDFTKVDNPVISFSLFLKSEEDWDGMILEIKKPGENWKKVGTSTNGFYNNNKTENPDWNFGTPWWSGYTGGWINKSISIPELSHLSEVSFRFRFNSDQYENDEGAAIDDFKIENTTTGINDIHDTNNLNVYPNPTSGLLHIEFNTEINEHSVAEVQSLSGKTVFVKTINSSDKEIQLDLSHLHKGLYILKITHTNKTLQSKIIINK